MNRMDVRKRVRNASQVLSGARANVRGALNESAHQKAWSEARAARKKLAQGFPPGTRVKVGPNKFGVVHGVGAHGNVYVIVGGRKKSFAPEFLTSAPAD